MPLPDRIQFALDHRSPAEEAARVAIDAALADARRIMEAHRLTAEGVTIEFLSHAVDRMWNDEDREALRAKVHASADLYIDSLFDFLGGIATRAA